MPAGLPQPELPAGTGPATQAFGSQGLRFSQLAGGFQLALALFLPFPGFALAGFLGGFQEGLLLGIKLAGIGLRPFDRLGQARPTVKRPGILLQAAPIPGLPRSGGGAARRPSRSCASHSRSVGHSRIRASCATSALPSLVVIRRASASLTSTCFDLLRVAIGCGRHQLAKRRPAAGVLGALAQLGQAQEDIAGDLLLHGGQLAVVDPLGRFGDRPAHPAGFRVSPQVHQVGTAPLPGFEQRM